MPPYIRSVTAGAPGTLVRVQPVVGHPPRPVRTFSTRNGGVVTYQPVVNHPPKPLRDYRRANTSSLGATAIEYGTVPVSPPPVKQPRGAVTSFARRQQLARSVRGSSLGGDSLGATDGELLQQLVDSQKRTEAAQQHWFEGDLFWKRLGVVATVMIPVSAAIWRRFGIGRRKPKP